MIKAVIFDMDGVLVDTEPIMEKMMLQIFDELNIGISNETIRSYRGVSSQKCWSELKQKYFLPETVDYYVKERLNRGIEHFKIHGVRLVDNVLNMLKVFKELSLKSALATSAAEERMKIILELTGIQDQFDTIISASSVINSKPDPEIFLTASKQMSIKPEDCLVIEDSTNGVKAAKNGGMKCIGFDQYGEQDLTEADIIINSFCDENIDHIINYFGLNNNLLN